MYYTTNHFCQRGRKVALIVVATLAVASGRSAIHPETEPTSLYLNVEKDGGLVTGLTQGNFRLYVDGKPQPFRLERPEEPASITLLVEHSASSGYFLNDFNASMQGFLKHAPEGHWYAGDVLSRA